MLLITLTMPLFYSSVPGSLDSVTVSQHAQCLDPKTEAAKWNSPIINSIIYTCAFSIVTSQKAQPVQVHTVLKRGYISQIRESTSVSVSECECVGAIRLKY